MTKESSIEIINDSDKEMSIIHEPEGFEFMLPPKEVVKIEFDAVENSLAIRYGIMDGVCIVSILPDKSYYRVLYNNVNVFKEFL